MNPAFCTRGAGHTCGLEGQDPDAERGATQIEYLFWVGCAGAIDDRAKKVTKAVAELLHIADVEFAVLGSGETCSGDPARRMGNEFLFQQLAMENVETLNAVFEERPAGRRKPPATGYKGCLRALLKRGALCATLWATTTHRTGGGTGPGR